MTRNRIFPILALLAALTVLTAACGQKSGVHDVATEGGGGGDSSIDGEGGGDDEGFAVGEVTEDGQVVIGIDEEGNAILADADSEEAKKVLRQTRTTTRTRGTTTTTPDDDGGDPGEEPPTTRVWGPTITIGIHAPITGAAPLPSSFQAAADFVRDYYNAKGGIHGRTLQIVIKDDQYQPAVATQRCTEMVKQQNAFLLIGAAGTDQIQACARYAATAGVPYLSAGVTEKGLTRLKNYFAISMSYKAQIPYLVKFVKQKFPDETGDESKMFMVYSDTPNFRDAVAAWRENVPNAQVLKLSRVPSQPELNAAAAKLCSRGAKMAFPLMAPKDWLFIIGQQSCDIQWSGIGVTMGVNEVAKNACRTAGEPYVGSTFFSPFPGIDEAANMDAEFRTATASEKPDDIWVALWGTTKGMAMLLDKVGPELTRARFVTTMENTTGLATGLGPVLNYSPTNHFGATETHVLEARCNGEKNASGKYPQGGQYYTIEQFLKY